MGYKTISTIMAEETDSALITAAAEMALRVDGHLDVTAIGIDPIRPDVIAAAGAPVMVMPDMSAEAGVRAKALAKTAEAAAAATGALASVENLSIPQYGLDIALARRLRYADLAISGRPYGRGPLYASLAEAALFGSRLPLLMLPEARLPRAGARVLIAWNESDEALAAIRAAMPLLIEAERVDIALVDPSPHSVERSDPGGALCVMLSRHGVRCEVAVLARAMPRTSEVLMRHAEEHGSELVVMGAFGHTRFREALLGGCSRDMLDSSPLPLLMAH